MSKRFRVLLHVDDLTQSIAFHNRLFAAQPARHETDCANWMLDEQAVDFALSGRGAAARAAARCTPTPREKPIGIVVKSQASCC